LVDKGRGPRHEQIRVGRLAILAGEGPLAADRLIAVHQEPRLAAYIAEPAQVIDKGIPTAGLLAQVPVAKYLDQLPLYRQEAIFGRAGLALPRSTLAQWVGATDTHVARR